MADIHTQRLILRPICTDDRADMYKMDSDPLVHRYLGNTPVKDIRETDAVIELLLGQYERFGIGRWAVTLKESGKFIGWSGLKFVDTPVNGKINFYDLGYRFLPEYWDRGYASESAKAWLDFAWNTTGLKEVNAYCEKANLASVSVLRKTGFSSTGDFVFDNAPHAWFRATP